MASIGYLNKLTSGAYEGKLQLMSLKTGVELKMLPNADKRDARHPDFRLTGNGVEIGAAWIKDSRSKPGETYISVVIAAPELPRTLYATLGQMAGQDDADLFSLIWNPDTGR